MTEHPNVELTGRGYDAFAKGDLAALSARRPALQLLSVKRSSVGQAR
jgi:hypothetical protein